MSNPWFRMYSEFSHDPKVQMLSEPMQRRYIMLMCMRCSNVLVTLRVTEIAFHLRISNDELEETRSLFIEKGFIDSDWNLLNWEKRQFVSDRSAPRVAKHRALQKSKQQSIGNADVTLQKRKSNALDTDTDTDTDKKDIGAAAFADATTKTVSVKNLVSEGVDKQKAADWLILRKAKRLPLTLSAWADTKAEGEKVGLTPADTVAHAVNSNWAGFKASWYSKDHGSAAQSGETGYQRSMRERYEEATGTSSSRQIIDITPTSLEIAQ